MSKNNYELSSWMFLYETNARTIKELEKHYKVQPDRYIKEQIITCLKNQKDLLKKINSCGFNKYYFDTFKINKKYQKESKKLESISIPTSKVVKSRKPLKATYRFATSLLIASLFMGASSSYIGKSIDKEDFTPKFTEEFLENHVYTQETVEVKMPTAIGSQTHITFHTLELENKHYDIKCPIELQDYFYELEAKWNIPASLAMLIVDQETDGQWNANGVISSTDDYGLSQINICNHKRVYNALGYTSEDLKNDPYKNLDAMFYLLTRIFNLYGYTMDNYDIENVCGTYNGYVEWESKKQSVNYVDECMERYNTKFADDIEKEKLLVRNAY